MKRPTNFFVVLGRSAAVLTLTGGMVSTILVTEANAQDLNGIFYPRSSEEFFQEGLDRLEDEVMRLQRMDDAGEGDRPVLNIDESVPNQQDELEEGDRWLINRDPMNIPGQGEFHGNTQSDVM